MATKIKTLSGAPADFHIPITVQELDGSEAEIIFTCKGRTLKDWHPVFVQQLTDDANNMIEAAETQEAAKTASETKKKGEAKPQKRLEFNAAELEEAVQKGLSRAIEIIRKVAGGWDLEDEFSDANLEALTSRYPGVHQALWAKYDERIRGNRLGNSSS